MAKRFTSTDIWEEDWFLDMPTEYKLFWFYMLSACDHAGLFKVNLRSFCGLNGVEISQDKVLELFNNGKDRIRIVNQSVWLVEDFFVYQYGTTFNPNNRVHASIEDTYNKLGIKMTSIRGLLDLKDRVKDKDKDIKKGGVGENRNGKVKGVQFGKDFETVVLSDGTIQELGKLQKEQAKAGELNPQGIFKNAIF